MVTMAYWYMDHGTQKWKVKSLGILFALITLHWAKLKCGKQKKDDKFKIYTSSN